MTLGQPVLHSILKRGAVLQVTAHFSPVLHHFFLETFRHPAHWFERRLQYTRSVAVNSMAGTATRSCDETLLPRWSNACTFEV